MKDQLNKIKSYVMENKGELLLSAGLLTTYALGFSVGYKYCKKTVEVGIGEVTDGNIVYKNIKIINRG